MAERALKDVMTAFYIGSYQRCVSLGQKVTGDEDVATIRDSFVFRAFLAMKKYDLVINEALDTRPIDLQALQKLAVFLKAREKGNEEEKDAAMSVITKWVDSGADNTTLLLVHGTMRYLNDDLASALEVLQKAKRSFDCMALTVQIMLKMARIDLARDVLAVMTAVDDESPLVQMTNVWVNLAMGGEYIKEAYYICEELTQRYTSTPLLLNHMAVSEIRRGNYEAAEELLQKVQEADPEQADAVANMVVVAQMTGRSDLAQRLRRQIQSQRSLTLPAYFLSKEKEFDRLCAEMAASV